MKNIIDLKERVLRANLSLMKNGLVIQTWGNVSEIDRESGIIVIKPSGVSYNSMKAEDMVQTDTNGITQDSILKPSSDLDTHLVLYNAFKSIGGIAHTHSPYATAWAQSGRAIPFYGTTHADYFYGDIPCTRRLSQDEVESDYEKNTGRVIVETFEKIKPMEMQGVLVCSHGVFCWGKTAEEASEYAHYIEEVAKLAFFTECLSKNHQRAEDYLLEKHYQRKHGKNAYYGQK